MSAVGRAIGTRPVTSTVPSGTPQTRKEKDVDQQYDYQVQMDYDGFKELFVAQNGRFMRRAGVLLYNSDGEAYFIYDPRKTNWWTNGFNPSIQDAHQEDLIASGIVDFSASPSLWNGFYSRWKTTPGWCFDEEHKVAYYAW